MRSSFAIAAIFATVISLSASERATAAADAGVESTYEKFRSIHRKGQDFQQGTDAVSFVEREALFNARKAEVAAHNVKKETWKLTVNHFADYTKDELKAMHGLKRAGARWSRSSGGGESSFLQVEEHGDGTGNIDTSSLAKTVDWRTTLNFSNFVHDQGACGSCWAHAAVASIEAHAEIVNGIQHELSTQSVIDCAPNPRSCGGTGGCKGSTAEIAFEFFEKTGIPTKEEFTNNCDAMGPSAVKLHGFVRVPENRQSFLKHALAEKGPVVMSIDANHLHLYHNGVFSGCQANTVPNHAVLGVGYGHDEELGKDYWQIKNSWGGNWGEKGYLRVENQNNDRWMCGTDVKPQDGVYCEKHPDTIPVCGMCGVVSDSAYPIVVPTNGPKLRHTTRNAHAKFGQVNLFSGGPPQQDLFSVF